MQNRLPGQRNTKILQKLTKRVFDEGKPRKEVINMQEGNRTLSIVSISPGNFIQESTKKR